MLKKYLKDITNKPVTSYYGFDLRKDGNTYYFSMVGHYTWDFWLGEGKTIEDAVRNVKVVTNCYHHEDYQPLNKKLQSYQEVDFHYKPEEVMKMKSITIMADSPVESFYTFVDEEDAFDFFKRKRSPNFHRKIMQKIDGKWIDVTEKFKL